jgi:hypothetical protein
LLSSRADTQCASFVGYWEEPAEKSRLSREGGFIAVPLIVGVGMIAFGERHRL